ncbi:(deoxy)nucleoside triphosphate pyrophosphohydrolase [Prolixibacter sp. NT017]|uniref:(deoxy)nucleoside triphosphate pyrophosphohydrolase n=1 Tax=Prolixibacter sp. NT017 TaxID=2652390 RepID=UPI0012894075|nr:(deoxy)nucleoside triphosphate pyrophosphohydrolase [Prolixibacter sp. NT017]GET27468.1 NUDIX hydrolase [Prolixibacter sp. NT017]
MLNREPSENFKAVRKSFIRANSPIFTGMVNVVCAIIQDENKFLACRRKQGKARGGKWEFPGGKVKEDESPEEAIERELHEELSLDVKAADMLGAVVHHYPDISIRLIAMKCFVNGGTISLTDHDEFRWVPVDELHSLDFSEADCQVIDEILLV